MLASTLFTLLAAGLASAVPLTIRDVSLNAAAVAEAQVRDNTATRAFTATTITTSSGKCLSVDPFSGDFRENLTPVTAVACDGSANQTWDVITAGVHNNVKGQALIVSSLTNACLNFDPRRAAGNQVLLFSCGGRADGGGAVTNSQLFAFNGGAGPLPFVPQNGNNATCLTIDANNALDQTACNPASASGAELFSFGGAAASSGATKDTSTTAAQTTAISTSTSAAECVASEVTKTVTVTSKQFLGVLNPSAIAQSQKKDLTATRAATAAQIKDSNGDCLSVSATAGSSRENLIPVELLACDGSDGQKWDFITKGVHNDIAGETLIVSSLINGCISFDPRRAAGDQVTLFSCGGRADGNGKVSNSQLFPFTTANLTAPYALTPSNKAGVCLVNQNGRLVNTNCNTASPDAAEVRTLLSLSFRWAYICVPSSSRSLLDCNHSSRYLRLSAGATPVL
ncbi:hypothetical protein B0H11DRAFT_1699148 [Mycena galericulata]|nr:hypothetical protein B0H11DRAFT_1699148 [Mycena galericulata]